MLSTDNKAIGVVKPGHVFTIEPMICEGVHQELMWYVTFFFLVFIRILKRVYDIGLMDGQRLQKMENAQHNLNTHFWLLKLV